MKIKNFSEFSTREIEPIQESWKDKVKNLLVAAGLSATLLTGCNSEKAYMMKLKKENPKAFARFYKENPDGSYELKPAYKKLASKEEKDGKDCGSKEADQQRAKFVIGR